MQIDEQIMDLSGPESSEKEESRPHYLENN
jgi:hypothetical protein